MAEEFRFLYTQGVWRHGETLKPTDQVKDVLKQGTLSVGFIGLAEALRVLVGETHTSEKAEPIGLEIINIWRDVSDVPRRDLI